MNADLTKHECDACDGYYVGPWQDAVKMGWEKKSGGLLSQAWTLLLCDDCARLFAARRAATAEQKATV